MIEYLIFLPFYGSWIIGMGMGFLTFFSLPVLIAGLIGTKFYELGKFKLSYRVFVFIFYIFGALFSSIPILLFLPGAITGGSEGLVFLSIPFFVSIVSLVFITFFEIRNTVNSRYWALLLAHFCSCLVLAIILIPIFWTSGGIFGGLLGRIT
jgi:hypothetical protein